MNGAHRQFHYSITIFSDDLAFLEEHAEAAEADIKEASREEIYEIRQMIS